MLVGLFVSEGVLKQKRQQRITPAPVGGGPLKVASPSDPDDQVRCGLLYRHYQHTHRMTNPLTATFETFCGNLPDCVVFEARNGNTSNLAFDPGNEIVYMCSQDLGRFGVFAPSLIDWLFGNLRRDLQGEL